jgi:hypothetical protein
MSLYTAKLHKNEAFSNLLSIRIMSEFSISRSASFVENEATESAATIAVPGQMPPASGFRASSTRVEEVPAGITSASSKYA